MESTSKRSSKLTRQFNVLTEMADITSATSESSVIVPRYNDVVLLRRSVYKFMRQIAELVSNSTVLEIGPTTLGQDASLPLKQLMPPFFNLKDALVKKGNKYLSCDMNQQIQADYPYDFMKIEGSELFDVIIALEVLEHCSKVWEVPYHFSRLLKPNGIFYVSTPYYMHHHDPHPDYWRISEEGYHVLFSEDYDLNIIKVLWKADDGQRPVHLRVKGVKV